MRKTKKRFLSVLLACAMIISLFPIAAFADSTSLPQAEDGVITLTEDVTLTSACIIDAGASLTIDLNGHKITNADGQNTIENRGTLIINDSSQGKTGVVDNISHGKAAIYNYPTGTVTLNGGTFDRSYEKGSTSEENGGNSYYTLKNFGTMTINPGVTVQQDGTSNSGTTGKYSSLVANGWYSISTAGQEGQEPEKVGNGATLTINGGTFKGGLNTIKNDDCGTVVIKDGTFTNFAQAVVQNHNILTIEGGNYAASADTSLTTYGVDNCGCVAETDIGTLTITGGTFSNVTYAVYDRSTKNAQVNISGGSFSGSKAAVAKSVSSKATISITGGTFSSDVSSLVPVNYECTKDESTGKFTVQKMDNKLAVGSTTDNSGNVSATLEGTFVGNSTGTDEDTDVADNTVSVDITTGESAANTNKTELTVNADTAKSLANADELTVKSDVATVTLDQTALAKMQNVTSDVVIAVEKNTSTDNNVAASYTVTVESNNTNLLPDGQDNGTVTITVPTSDTTVQPWYVVGSIYVEKLNVVSTTENSITFEIGHLSTIDLLKSAPTTGTAVGSITTDGTVTYYDDAASFITAINGAKADSVVDLMADVAADSTLSADSISAVLHVVNGITINGNGYTLSYNGSSAIKHIINVTADDTTINDLIIDATNANYGVHFYCTTSGTLNKVNISNAKYACVSVNGAQNIVIKDSKLNKGNGYECIEYAMGSGVQKIPSMSISNVSFDATPYVLADKTTTNAMKTIMNGDPTNEEILNKILENVAYTNPNGGKLNIVAQFAGATGTGEYLTGSVESTYQPPYTGKYSYAINVANMDNGSVSVDKYATEGEKVTLTVSPDKAYKLDELTVTANGKDVELTDNGDGTYTFTMPGSKVQISATFVEDENYEEPTPEEPSSDMPFGDVNTGDWFYDVVKYAYDNGLMTGTSATTFEPNTTTTRGMIVAILNRLEGNPTAADAGFADVNSGDWYADAVNWAASVGIVNGYSDTQFGPNDPITREQMAAILYNYAEYKGYDVSARADISSYDDAANVSDWAIESVQWANAMGLVNGMTDTTLDPQGNATRAQIAAILSRYLTGING